MRIWLKEKKEFLNDNFKTLRYLINEKYWLMMHLTMIEQKIKVIEKELFLKSIINKLSFIISNQKGKNMLERKKKQN